MSDGSQELRRQAQKERYDDRGLSLSTRHVAFASWVLVAGLYGHFASEYGSASIDMGSASPYPPDAWLFVLFGAALATGMYASVSLAGDDDE